jgi:hypothetical protein
MKTKTMIQNDTFGRLLTVENAKTIKGEKLGYLTGILYLTPARVGTDSRNLCPYSTAGCRAGCLVTAGRGRFDSVIAGRARKRALFDKDPQAFVHRLYKEIALLEKRARAQGLRPAVRLNGTSDIAWEYVGLGAGLFQRFPKVKFYDYTKIPARAMPGRRVSATANGGNTRTSFCITAPWPGNYDMTYSHAEGRETMTRAILAAGGRVSVVFNTPKGKRLPFRFMGARVVDGDTHDLMFKRPQGVVVGLRAKGKARGDRSGFVVNVDAVKSMGGL